MRRWIPLLAVLVAGCGLGSQAPGLTSADATSTRAQLEPSDSQAKADKKASKWATDARQVGVGYAFYRTTLLSGTTHVYHSKQLNQVFIVAFAGTSWLSKERVDQDGKHALIARLLGTVKPSGMAARQIYEEAKRAGLNEEKVTIGGLIQPPLPLVPSLWTFHVYKPQVFLNAKTGKPLLSIASQVDPYLVPEWFDPDR